MKTPVPTYTLEEALIWLKDNGKFTDCFTFEGPDPGVWLQVTTAQVNAARPPLAELPETLPGLHPISLGSNYVTWTYAEGSGVRIAASIREYCRIALNWDVSGEGYLHQISECNG